MTKYEKIAQKAIAARLATSTPPVMLFTISNWADSAAQAAGKKYELYPSLHDYVVLLPANWAARWLKGKGNQRNDDVFLCAVPNNFSGSDWQHSDSPDD